MVIPQYHFGRCLLVWALILAFWKKALAGQPIKYRSYLENVEWLEQLNTTFPEVVQVFIAQEKYKLPFPPQLLCNGETEPPLLCKQYVVHLTNHSTIASDPDRPEVFISGALHGDERVGPVSAMELIALMAQQATAFATHEINGSDVNVTDDVLSSHLTQKWIWELLNTRSVFVIPMTNAYGYAHKIREELDVDSNRDFIYLRYPDCMKAMTSRVLNELWRDHMFQVAATFHGGMRAIAYEWGTPNHYLDGVQQPASEKSPDHRAQFQLAAVFSKYAGAFSDGNIYPTGMMNDLVYGVTGGMEDWAYAASWENQFYQKNKGQQLPFGVCTPTTYGGYEASKTVYNNMTHRAFNFLVETSNSKEPDEKTLGIREDLYNRDLDYFDMDKNLLVGHVVRNVRLALMLIEMVQPYIRWVSSNPQTLSSVSLPYSTDFAPASKYTMTVYQSCSVQADAQLAFCNNTTCNIRRDPSFEKLTLQLSWEALGSLNVSSTFLQLSNRSSFSELIYESPISLSGRTRRHFDAGGRSSTPQGFVFVDCVDLTGTMDVVLFARAVAILDQDWKDQGTNRDTPSPHIPPQSHLVNARTNDAWNMSWNGHRVKASTRWYSPVITIRLVIDREGSAALARHWNSSLSPSSSSGSVNKTVDLPGNQIGSSSNAGVSPPTISQTNNSKNSSSIEPSYNSSVSIVPTSPAINGTSSANVSHVPTSTKPSIVAKKQGNHQQETEVISLLGVGYTVLVVGGFVIVVTLAALYRRVFRSRRKQKRYINVNEQSSLNADELRELDSDSDREEDESEGEKLAEDDGREESHS